MIGIGVKTMEMARRLSLMDLIHYLYNMAPSDCWGGAGKVKAWLERVPSNP